METKIDLKDKKILYQLDLNSRQSNAQIAKKVQLSKDSVGYRIKALEQKGIIRSYTTVIDSSKLGYLFYRVFFNLIDMNPKKLEELINYLKKQRNVWWIAKLDGAWNFAFAVWTKSNKEFQEFYEKLGLNFRENIKEKLISPIISYQNLSRTYLLENKQESKTTSAGESKKEQFDKTDLEILKLLSKNARIPLIEIAHKLKLDNMTIYHRIKKLEKKKIIQGYRVNIDFNLLKRDFYSVKINLKNLTKLKEIKTHILTIPEAIATTEAIGSYDIEFDLEVENSEQYFKIIEKLESKFEDIREIIYFRVLKNYKILYMPEED
jgi:DNA-binding Lrp family transcriptional regulator